MMRRLNWPIWIALPLSAVTLISYPLLFVRWPITRDIPWVNLLLLAATLWLVVSGIRRAFAGGRRWIGKIASVVVAATALYTCWTFVDGVLIGARRLPASAGAPQVGQKAPDFTLTDLQGRATSLSDLLSTANHSSDGGSRRPKAALLIFYRGYW
jgi:hypothetical protein